MADPAIDTRITTVARIIHEMEEDPELKRQLRAVLLSDDLLALPKRFDHLEGRFDHLEGRFDHLGERFDHLEDKVDVIRSDLDEVKSDMTEVKSRLNRIDGHIGNIVGGDLERRMVSLLTPRLSQQLSLRGMEVVWHTQSTQSPNRFFMEALEDASDAGKVSAAEAQRVWDTDLVARAHRRDQQDGRVWIAVEASSSIARQDIDKVRKTADVLSAMFDEEAVPIAIGYRVRHEERAHGEAAGVTLLTVPEPT